ncbi:MAG: TrmB family transcriptional regulator [Halobacteriaceae archaeon]
MATLQDLGLSEYEARTYRSLLDVGPTTAKELSAASDVPMGRIYDVLNALETQNLVRSQTASRPKKYVAVEPETALDRLLTERKRDLRERADQYESTVETLKRDLHAGVVAGDGFWTAALGPEDSLELYIERLDAAQERIVGVAGVPAAAFDLAAVGDRVADRVEAALDRGVTATVLVARDLVESVPEQTTTRFTDDLAAREGFEVRVTEDVGGTFTVVDGVEVCIEVPHPLDADQPFAMINLKDPSFAADVRAEFEPRWDTATVLRP